MESLYLLIPMSVLLVFLIGMIFWWSVRSGQFDDLEGPGYRVVSDDDTPQPAPRGSVDKDKEGA
ncbi:MAG: cbb3-type cytochrome oxidase assembly protein CcoS [Proteobacteria bacterium]|nr:cbb3-type cytochrome oxidase assembly protein CcoS [Pseudomonadota bacterium]